MAWNDAGMGSMAFGATVGRTAAGDLGMTQPAVPPLCIDPLVTAMLQRAGTDAPPLQPRSTSAAFAVRILLCCAVLNGCTEPSCANHAMPSMLSCAMPSHAVPCCAALCCAALPCVFATVVLVVCYAVLCRPVRSQAVPTMPHHAIPGHAVLCQAIHTISCHTVLCCAVLCCAVLCCAVLCCAVLCCIMAPGTMQRCRCNVPGQYCNIPLPNSVLRGCLSAELAQDPRAYGCYPCTIRRASPPG